MAKVHGVAGAYPKNEARRRLAFAFFSLAAILMGFGFFVGFFLSTANLPLTAVSFALALVLLVAATLLLERFLADIDKERMKFVRGGRVRS